MCHCPGVAELDKASVRIGAVAFIHRFGSSLRYCAGPPFALDRLCQRGAELVYHCPKSQSGGKQADLVLSPLELIERIAALVPPPRTHRQDRKSVV